MLGYPWLSIIVIEQTQWSNCTNDYKSLVKLCLSPPMPLKLWLLFVCISKGNCLKNNKMFAPTTRLGIFSSKVKDIRLLINFSLF